MEIFSVMESFEKSLRNNSPGSVWDQIFISNYGITVTPEHSIRFPDITSANVYTHLWNFRIIIATEISRLVAEFPLSNICDHFPSRNVQEHNETLATQICCSMGYLIQDRFKLYGPASAMLPLQTAYKVFIMDKQKNAPHITFIEECVECLVEKGIRSAPYIVYY